MRVLSESERHEARRRWLTTKDAAELLGVSADQVRELIAAKELRAMNVARNPALSSEYRIRPEWVDSFIEARTNGPKSAA